MLQNLSSDLEKKALLQALVGSFLVHCMLIVAVAGRSWFQTNQPLAPQGIEVGIVSCANGGTKGVGKSGNPASGPKKEVAQKSKPVESSIQKAKADNPAALKKTDTVKPVQQTREDLTQKKDVVSLKPEKNIIPSKASRSLANTKAKDKADPANKAGSSIAPASANRQSAISSLSEFLSDKRKEGSIGAGAGTGKSGNGQGAGGSMGGEVGGITGSIYLRQMQNRIQSYWQVPGGIDVTSMSASFFLQISRNGELRTVKLVQSSGSDLFDLSAKKALIAAQPFEVLPASIQEPFEVTVRLVPPR